MRFAAMVLLVATSLPAHAIWVEVDALSAPCDAAGINVTFTAGDFLEDGRRGWLVGTYRAEGGQRLAVLRTTNGRTSWTATWTDINAVPATAVDFIDANHGWLVAGSEAVYRTEDGGRTWTSERVHGPAPVLRDIAMVDATHGFIAGRVWRMERAAVFQYDAAERDWEQFLSESPGTLNGLAARSASLLWAAGVSPESDPLAYRRRSGEWQPMTIPSSVQALSFIDNRRGFAACTAGRIFATTNAGVSWQEKLTPILGDLTDLHFSSSNDGAALSAPGRALLVTDDGALSWSVERVPEGATKLLWDGSKYLALAPTGLYVREQLRRITPVPALQRPQRIGPAEILPMPGPFRPVGTWREATELQEPFPAGGMRGRGLRHVSAASFLDDGQHGWVIGWEARNIRAVLRTRNGGATWELLNHMGLPDNIGGVQFVDADNGWLWGGATILHTRDGGESWAPERIIREAGSAAVREVGMFNARNGVAIMHVTGADHDTVLRRDAGAGTWRVVATVTASSELAVDPSGFMWIAASVGALRSGTDPTALTSTTVSLAPAFFLKLMLHDRNNGWALLSRETTLYRTTNGGADWQHAVFALDPADYAVDGALAGPNHCYVLTRLGRVLETTDGGANWDEVHRVGTEADPGRSSIHVFGRYCYAFEHGSLWTTVPPREPVRTLTEAEPFRPVLASSLLSWSSASGFGAGVAPAPGHVGREAIFRVQWDRRNARRPGEVTLRLQAPGAGAATAMPLRRADYWGFEDAGSGDLGVAYTPVARGEYRYCFAGANEEGTAVTGDPSEWRTWRVE